MRKLPLKRGLWALVDDIDYPFLSQWKWSFNGKYAYRTDRGKTICMQRVVARRSGLKVTNQVDHRNQNKLDNRRKNLRPATQSQNQANRGPTAANTSGFKGVFWYERYGRWYARIRVNKQHIFLGYFKRKNDAARAYNAAAKKYFGEFAFLNKV